MPPQQKNPQKTVAPALRGNHVLVLKIFSDLGRRHSDVFFEHSRKIILIGTADRLGDLAHRKLRAHQKVARLCHTNDDHISMRRIAHYLFEKMREMSNAQTAFLGELLDRKTDSFVTVYLARDAGYLLFIFALYIQPGHSVFSRNYAEKL